MTVVIEAPTAIGSFYLSASSAGVVGVTFPGVSPERHFARVDLLSDDNGGDIAAEAARQIRQFIDKEIRRISVPIDLPGETQFRSDVYKTLRTIPYGGTVTYGELALMAGYPGAARAVGTAMKHNPLSLIIPCHRVVGAGNTPGGWTGPAGLKTTLLRLEQEGLAGVR